MAMHGKGQALMSSAIKQARRVRRTTGRLVVSGLGFGLAYFFDAENGGARREQLRRSLRRTAFTIDSVWAPAAGDPPAVFTPLLRGLSAEEYEPRPAHFGAN
jgi:hypothetical protein